MVTVYRSASALFKKDGVHCSKVLNLCPPSRRNLPLRSLICVVDTLSMAAEVRAKLAVRESLPDPKQHLRLQLRKLSLLQDLLDRPGTCRILLWNGRPKRRFRPALKRRRTIQYCHAGAGRKPKCGHHAAKRDELRERAELVQLVRPVLSDRPQESQESFLHQIITFETPTVEHPSLPLDHGSITADQRIGRVALTRVRQSYEILVGPMLP